MAHFGLIDLLAWDLKSKKPNLPAYKLMGGNDPKIPAYAATWIDMAALDMVRTSSFYKGGLTGALKIAHLAEAHEMKAEVHGMGVANAHLGAAIPNNDFYEQLVFSTEHIKGLRKQNELPIIDGFITAPETPGLGLDVDWAALDKTALAVV